jgi:alanyl-tRNA synthetase
MRQASIPRFRKELCDRTHVSRTGDIGLCKITYEGSISAGVRRIEAITGEGALKKFQETVQSIHRVSDLVHVPEAELIEHVEKLLDEKKALEKRVEQMKDKLARAQVAELESAVRDVKGVKVLAAEVPGMDREQLRTLVDSFRAKWKSMVVVLASSEDSNVAIVSGVTKDLTSKVHAGKLAGAVAQAVGGKGGGRPDMAEAGGKDLAALPAALQAVYASVEGML